MAAEMVEVQQHGIQVLEVFKELVTNPWAAVRQRDLLVRILKFELIRLILQQHAEALRVFLRRERVDTALALIIENAHFHFFECLIAAGSQRR